MKRARRERFGGETRGAEPGAETLRLEVESIAAGGDGVARSDGLVVFIPRSAPGDHLRAVATKRGAFARGEIEWIEQPSRLRVEPQCAHYTRDHCGGCQIQHLTYDAQLAAKAAIVRDALQRIARRECELPHVVGSPEQWRYRTRLTLTMRNTGRGWIAGLREYDRPGRIFDLRDCPITHETIVATWKEIMQHSALFPRERELRGSVRLTGLGPVFVLSGGSSFARADDFFAAVTALQAMWWDPADGERVIVGDRRPHDSAEPGASFEQVNSRVADELRAFTVQRVMREDLPRTASRTGGASGDAFPIVVVDAYAGSGTTARMLVAAGAVVTAIEVDEDAARWASSRLGRTGNVVAARVEDVLEGVLPADVVLLNPPRGGLHPKVPEILTHTVPRPQRIVYVSCDPATLARDLNRIPEYRITHVRCFDMFPQTAHVETVCELENAT